VLLFYHRNDSLVMRNFAKLLLLPLLAAPMIPSESFAYVRDCCTGSICAIGKVYCPEWIVEQQLKRQRRVNTQIAQYMPTQYYPAQMMGGGGSPVIVPPTVINTQGYEHNSSKKSCKESVIDMFLFSVRRTTGDCTP
jgi:hypothetical protein